MQAVPPANGAVNCCSTCFDAAHATQEHERQVQLAHQELATAAEQDRAAAQTHITRLNSDLAAASQRVATLEQRVADSESAQAHTSKVTYISACCHFVQCGCLGTFVQHISTNSEQTTHLLVTVSRKEALLPEVKQTAELFLVVDQVINTKQNSCRRSRPNKQSRHWAAT